MQRVKLFKSVENEVASLEQEINEWIESSGATIIHCFGNISEQTMATQKAGTTGRTSRAMSPIPRVYGIDAWTSGGFSAPPSRG